jgi:hypothetical protein
MLMCSKILWVAYQMETPLMSFQWHKNELSVFYVGYLMTLSRQYIEET